MQKYELEKITGVEALVILKEILFRLSEIDEDDMTTLELAILHMCADPKPKRWSGQENQINNSANQFIK